MIRGIYAELLKTADYRDRLNIEKHAMQSESVRRSSRLPAGFLI
jgi:putative DNA primase/helicase